MSRKTKAIRKATSYCTNQPSVVRRWWAGLGDEHKRAVARTTARIFLLVVLVAAVAGGMKWLEALVLSSQEISDSPRVTVQLDGRPAWMPLRLARGISQSLVDDRARYEDDGLAERVYRKAAGEPWIRGVKGVRKYRDENGRPVVRVQCEFRRPAAIAAWKGRCYYVDTEGVRLPDSPHRPQVPRWTASVADPSGGPNRRANFIELSHVPRGAQPWRIHYLVIELNDELDPPGPAVGKPWNCKALRAGLKLVDLLAGRKYARQITRVDVRNYAGRVLRNLEHLGFWAGGTYIKFGRFPHSDGVDWVVSPERKMANLDRYVAQRDGKLAGAGRVDLQIDNLNESTYGARLRRD